MGVTMEWEGIWHIRILALVHTIISTLASLVYLLFVWHICLEGSCFYSLFWNKGTKWTRLRTARASWLGNVSKGRGSSEETRKKRGGGGKRGTKCCQNLKSEIFELDRKAKKKGNQRASQRQEKNPLNIKMQTEFEVDGVKESLVSLA